MKTYAVLFILWAFIILIRSYIQRSRGKLPPSPGLALPVIGHLHLVPKRNAWFTFTRWAKEIGPVLYLNLAGQPVVILGNHKAAADLLDRRSAIYSDRARNIVAGKLLTGGLVFAFTSYNDLWRRMRRAAHDALSVSVSKSYHHMQETEAYLIVKSFLKDPSDFDNHLRRSSNSLALSMIYGRPPIHDSRNPDIIRVNRFVERALAAAAPGAFLVEYFTWMEHLPRWMCAWRRYAEDWFTRDSGLFERLFSDVEKHMELGDQTASVASNLIENKATRNLTDKEAAWCSATLYAAGGETTSGQMAWIILSMVLYPEVQKRAQAEIDRVVGRSRLPTFQDIDNLPYIHAIVKEILRWRGVGPLSIPHRLSKDDYYEGYFIPKDTIVIGNVWALNHDPDVYGPDAVEFRPERHLDEKGRLNPAVPDTKDESHVTYGFGRRICVGRHVSNNSMFIALACVLWALDLSPGKDSDGNIVLPDPMNFLDEGLVVRPEPFPCTMTVRYADVDQIVNQSLELRGQ